MTTTRFAPSPTGYIHVGNLRTALMNYLIARKSGGTFILRLDDTDQDRSKQEYADGIMADLDWLGLHWDRVEKQSLRMDRYRAAADELRAANRFYECFESPVELDLKRKKQLNMHRPPVYDRASLALTDAEKTAKRAEGRDGYWRFLLNQNRIEWADGILGPISIDAASVSDPVLIRADGQVLYTFASSVDDIDMGVTDIVSLSAVGSLKEELPPGTFVLIDQFIDRTFGREKSVFGTGCVGHVPFSHPISPLLQDTVAAALAAENMPFTRGGTYVVMEGPQFSTLAESQLYRSWGASVIGMTNMPEAKLAREAEICYCSVAMVTDYDSWHEDHGTVDVAKVVEVMKANSGNAKKLISRLAKDFPREHPMCPIGSDRALEHAIMTATGSRDPEMARKLQAIAGRVL